MKKVMFFAHDPGGANAIAPLISEFKNPLVYGKGPSLNILPFSKELPQGVLADVRPDFLITGTSANDFTERNLWNEASGFGIPSMAILDSWINYGVRFSEYGLDKLQLFQKACKYLPKYLCVMDDLAKEDAIKDGIPEEIILTFGNPHFEKTFMRAQNSKSISDGKRILFASQPFDDIYYKGSEETALKNIIETVKAYDNLKLLIRKHPKESPEKFAKYLDECVIMDNNTDVFDSIQQVEIIVSVNSMVLIEALFFGKKIISYQPKTKNGKNDFILTRNGTLPFIQNAANFKKYFNELLQLKNYSIRTDIKYNGIINRIKTFVEDSPNA